MACETDNKGNAASFDRQTGQCYSAINSFLAMRATMVRVWMSQSRKPLSQHLGLAIARLIGWRIEVPEAIPAKCVIVGAHHTSGSDFFITLIYLAASSLKFRWIAKDTAFRWPFGWLMRRLGGIPVTRASRNNFVDQVVAMYHASDRLRIAIAPEGTRSDAGYWRTGFYYIALGAGVPIMLGYADYRRKVVGIAGQFDPSGDIDADMAILRDFYADVTPRYPQRRGEVRLRPAAEITASEP
jgi:1-acyl-sn-glycerol-3-phosphate acyltransferase